VKRVAVIESRATTHVGRPAQGLLPVQLCESRLRPSCSKMRCRKGGPQWRLGLARGRSSPTSFPGPAVAIASSGEGEKRLRNSTLMRDADLIVREKLQGGGVIVTRSGSVRRACCRAQRWGDGRRAPMPIRCVLRLRVQRRRSIDCRRGPGCPTDLLERISNRICQECQGREPRGARQSPSKPARQRSKWE